MTFFRITLLRSGIGLPARTNGVLASLGLTKRLRTVYLPVSPDVAGKILKVKELIAVSEVEKPVSRKAMKEVRRPEPGFWVERAVSRDGGAVVEG